MLHGRRPVRARIHLAALAANLGRLRRAAPGTRLLAVVKANGYGHGVLRAARALHDADGLAVLELDAAARLRESGWQRPVALLEGVFEAAELEDVGTLGLWPVVHHEEQLRMLELRGGGPALPVLLKLNTGMNRLGFAPARLPAVLERLLRCPGVGAVTLMTHFACADEADGVAEQLRRFDAACTGLALPRSLANSAALLRYPETAADWARPGIALYGASPFAGVPAAQLGLAPAMTLESALIAVQELAPGDRVGYGGTFTAPRAMRVGVVGCGYADGYPRHAPTGTPVRVAGQPSITLGRVSMDMLCVDLSGLPEARPGTPVELWGAAQPVDAVAEAAGTIAYELLCALAPRVPVLEVD